MERRAFMSNMVLSELEDAVGVENVSCNQADKLTYGVDYFWVARMWADKDAFLRSRILLSGRTVRNRSPKS